MREKLKSVAVLLADARAWQVIHGDDQAQMARLELAHRLVDEIRQSMPREPSADDRPSDRATMLAHQRRRETGPAVVDERVREVANA